MSRSTSPRLGYSPAEWAALTGLCVATVHNRIADGSLRSVKIGGRRLILADELERLAVEQNPNVAALVERTTTASGVPVVPENPAALAATAQAIARPKDAS